MKVFVALIPALLALQSGVYCFNHTRGDLIFSEEFDQLDEKLWTHYVSGNRGGNWEFQYYRKNAKNSYVKNGQLHIATTLTSDEYGEDFIYNGELDLWQEGCRNEWDWGVGCVLSAGGDYIVNPVQSAKLISEGQFSFRYGTVEFRAQMPKGDWLWPAVWMMPESSVYGNWPRSGEIDLVESRGNEQLWCDWAGGNQGRQLVGCNLHWGPDGGHNGNKKTNWWRVNEGNDYASSFHTYRMEWNPEGITFLIDDLEMGHVNPPEGGFWQLGEFSGNNIWSDGSKMAPFDQNFYFIINVAVGGNFFPDGCTNAYGNKPWDGYNVPGSMKRFWEARQNWLPTWDMGSDERALKVDYTRVWSL